MNLLTVPPWRLGLGDENKNKNIISMLDQILLATFISYVWQIVRRTEILILGKAISSR